jgi:adenylate cyclase
LQPALIDLLLQDPRRLELGGETLNLTVLFSDLKGFTGIAERLTAGQLVTSLNDYFSRFAETAVSHGGYLDKYIGDAVMAVWGAPVPDERHAVSACRAALQLQAALVEIPWKLLGPEREAPVTRMGINSGEMVVGMVGSEGAAHYTVMGDNVVVASRLEGANKIYGTRILIGEGCYLQAQDEIIAREIDLVVLKGKSKPLRIYEPLGLASTVSSKGREKTEIFTHALELYRKRNWQKALALFRQVLSLEPADGPAHVFQERCLACAEKEPPESWAGEFIMPGK